MVLDHPSDNIHIQRSYPEQKYQIKRKIAFGLLMIYILCEKFGQPRNG